MCVRPCHLAAKSVTVDAALPALPRPREPRPRATGQLDTTAQTEMGDEEKKEGGEHINLKVVTQDGNEIYFKCKQTTPLQKLMHAFCNRQGVSMNSVRFLFDGNRVNETQTPSQLGMEDCGESLPPVPTASDRTQPLSWRADAIDVMVEQYG